MENRFTKQDAKDIMNAFQEAKFEKSSQNFLFFQLLIAAVCIGICTKSWIWGITSFAGLIFLLYVPYLGGAICVIGGLAIGGALGGIAGAIGGSIWGWSIGLIAAAYTTYRNFTGRRA